MALTKRVPTIQPYVIKQSKIQGRGGFATRLIRKGARVAEYLGDRISHEEGDRRYDDDWRYRERRYDERRRYRDRPPYGGDPCWQLSPMNTYVWVCR